MKTQPQKVDFQNDVGCIEAIVLGMMGRSHKLIQKRTKFTQHQVTYRLKAYGLKLKDVRNGEDPSFKTVYNATRRALAATVAKSHYGKEA